MNARAQFRIIVAFLVVWSSQSFGQDADNRQQYSDLLKEAVLQTRDMRSGPHGGIPSFSGLYGGIDRWKVRKFMHAQRLKRPQAIPFLIDVLQHGPNWEDDRLGTGPYPHAARCLAAVCLGATEDWRAYAPLAKALESVDPNEDRHYLASYAALGLGLLGDRRAVPGLVRALRDDRHIVRIHAANALEQLDDLRALLALADIVATASDENLKQNAVRAIVSIARIRIPPVRPGDFQFWKDWWRDGDEVARKYFDEWYGQWRQYRETRIERGETPSDHTRMTYRDRIVTLGIPALPFTVEAIERHPEDADLLAPAISRLTGNEVSASATPAQCLQWWDDNKHRWTLFGPAELNVPEMSEPDSRQRYSDLLKKAVLRRRRVHGDPHGGLPWVVSYSAAYGGVIGSPRDMIPVPGLDVPEAVPFLIEVLQKGPNRIELRLPHDRLRHVARCLSALCLGATKDSRAFEPLVEAMRIVDPNEGRYTVACYAAAGLGLLGDKRALEPLFQSLHDERELVRRGVLAALTLLGDVGSLEVLIPVLRTETDAEMRMDLIRTVNQLVKIKPVLSRATPKGYWDHWWENGGEMTRTLFNEHYGAWRQCRDILIEQDATPTRAAISMYRERIAALGVPALPLIVEGLREHPEDAELLMPVVSRLTDNKLPKTATPAQCLQWWKQNKEKWTIVYSVKSQVQSRYDRPGTRAADL